MKVGRIILAAAFVAFALFCAFGFLASFEPTEHALAWRVGYAVVGLLSVGAAVSSLWPRRKAR